jgi:hypothetical protein
MSEDIWKAYSGTESGVADDKDAQRPPKDAPPPAGAAPEKKP